MCLQYMLYLDDALSSVVRRACFDLLSARHVDTISREPIFALVVAHQSPTYTFLALNFGSFILVSTPVHTVTRLATTFSPYMNRPD